MSTDPKDPTGSVGAPARDAGPELDLTPRIARAAGPRRWAPFVVIAAIVVGLGFVATQALGDASMFFYNADEAVAKKAELADSRFRLQGKVLEGTTIDTPTGVEFTVGFNGVSVDVVHQGDPIDLFEDGAPVVLEGRWDPSGEVFSSDRMLVKHDETYVADNDERLQDAERGRDEP